MKRHTILLVEDEELIRSLLSEAMTDDGFDVIAMESGDAALRWLETGGSFDLLLTDIQLPGTLDGIAIAQAARERHPRVPIIFTTGQPDRVAPWPPGDIDLFIAKPYRPSEICSAITRMTGRQTPEPQ
jgi:DNA-binding response OmpR family regulator